MPSKNEKPRNISSQPLKQIANDEKPHRNKAKPTKSNRAAAETKTVTSRTKNRAPGTKDTGKLSKNSHGSVSLRDRPKTQNLGSITIKFESRERLDKPWKSMNKSCLSKSFMSGRYAEAGGSSNNNEGYCMKVFDVNTMGKNYTMSASVHFGEVDQRSKGCQLIVDTGTNLTYVTKKAYDEATQGTGVSQSYLEGRKKGKFSTVYNGRQVKGDLYEGSLSFFDPKTIVNTQIFGIVNEAQSESYLTSRGVNGILGLGSPLLDDRIHKTDTKGRVMKERIPNLLDSLEIELRIPECIVGITISLPSEIMNGPIDKGVFTGELHFGRTKDGAYDKKTMEEIPTVIGGDLESFYAVHLKLKCGNEAIMSRCEGIIDTGTPHIYLPPGVMKKYMNKVKKETGRDVVKFDKNTELYYLAKKDFKHLKDLEFEFSDGEGDHVASFKLPPTAQVFPPALTFDHLPKFYGNDTVYFAIKDLTDPNYSFILGAAWMMWYYIVLDSRGDHRKLGIAEIKDRKGYRWNGL